MNPVQTPFDFGAAVTQLFQTSGGAQFGRRLWFWTSLPIAISLLIAAPLIAPHYGPLLVWYSENFPQMMSGQSYDETGMLEVMKGTIPGYLVMLGGLWVSLIMGEAALHRKALLNYETSGRPIRLGADERRVFVAQIGVFTLMTLIYIGVIFLGAIFLALLGLLGAILFVLAILASIYFIINVAVRLMPAAGLSVREGQQRLLSARPVTKGRFWQLFGAYIVIYIAGSIGLSIVNQIGMSVVFGDMNMTTAMLGGDSEAMQAMVDESRDRLKNPIVIFGGVIAIIVYSAATALIYLSLSGVGTYAMRWWAGDNETADTFN